MPRAGRPPRSVALPNGDDGAVAEQDPVARAAGTTGDVGGPGLDALLGQAAEVRRVAEREDVAGLVDDPVAVCVARGSDRHSRSHTETSGVAEIEGSAERAHAALVRQHAVSDEAPLRPCSHSGTKVVELRVERDTRTLGDTEVAVTRDVRKRRRLADEVRERLGDPDVDALLPCLPREHTHHRDHRCIGRLAGPVVAEHHDPAAAGVEVQRVRADHPQPVDVFAGRHLRRRIVTRPTAFPDAAVRVDDEVVRDVGPTASLEVELVDRADVRGDVTAQGSRGVVDDELLDRRVRRVRQPLRLVGTPNRSRKDDRRRHVDRGALELARRDRSRATRRGVFAGPAALLRARDADRIDEPAAEKHRCAGARCL